MKKTTVLIIFLLLAGHTGLAMASILDSRFSWFSNHWKDINDRRYALYNKETSEFVTPHIYKNFLTVIDGITPAQLAATEKWGVLNTSGEIVVPFVYEYLFYFKDTEGKYDSVNGISAAQYNNKWGFINLNNDVVIPLIYDEMQTSELNNEGKFIIVRLNGKWGCINQAGNTLIPFEYDTMNFADIKNSLFLNATKEKEWRLITREPDGTIREYSKTENLFLLEQEKEFIWAQDLPTGLLTFIRADASCLIPPTYESTLHNTGFSNDMVRVLKDGKYGFINNKGVLVIPLQYDCALEKNGYVIIEKQAHRYMQNRQDTLETPVLKSTDDALVIMPEYHRLPQAHAMGISPSMLAEMRYVSSWKEAYGENGSKMNSVGEFSCGLALVSLKGHFGYIDKAGTVAIDTAYDWGTMFQNIEHKKENICVAAVKKGEKWAVINTAGKLLTKFNYDSYERALQVFRK